MAVPASKSTSRATTPQPEKPADQVRRAYREALYKNISAEAARGAASAPASIYDLRVEPIRSTSED